MIIKECSHAEYEEAIELINNVFRTSQGLEATMHKEFPLLLGKENMNNMILAIVEGSVVGCVNYYITTILVDGAPIKAASIGAVCTHKGHRGKNIASQLLNKAEENMLKQGVHLEIISGTGGIYEKLGATQAGPSYRYSDIRNTENTDDIRVVLFDDIYFDEILNIYNKEKTRYVRSAEEFRMLMTGATYPWGSFDFKFNVILKDHGAIAYVVTCIDKENRTGYTKEFSGDRESVIKSLEFIKESYQLKDMVLECSWNDPIVPLMQLCKCSQEYQLQSSAFKVLAYKKLMGALKPYLSEHLTPEEVDEAEYFEYDSKYYIKYKEQLELDNIHKLNLLIIGGLANKNDDCSRNLLVNKFIEKVFPIPMVRTGNMNFQ